MREPSLRDTVKRLLDKSKIPTSVISRESGVPSGALYHFRTKGEDMRSENMEKLYIYLTGEPLVK